MRNHHLLPLTLLALLTGLVSLQGQDNGPVEIRAERSGDTYTISIDARQLPRLQPEGDNDPYYSYYWEFGDYRFAHTTEASIEHVYPERLVGQEVEIKLFLKAHYALSPSIVRSALTRTLTIEAGRPDLPFEDVPEGSLWMSSSDFAPKVDTLGGGEEGKTTHQIQEKEDVVLIISIQPPAGQNLQGATLDLRMPRYSNFFGFSGMSYDPERLTPQEELAEGRRLPSRLSFALQDFSGVNGTNLFLYLTPDASGKKNALGKEIEVSATLSFNGGQDQAQLTFEVVKSRDPNRMLVASSYLTDWKDFHAEGIKYRVDFQNYGSGPVENGISVRIDLPRGSDPDSVVVLGHHSAACSSIRRGLSPCNVIVSQDDDGFLIINLDDAGLTSRDVDERRSKGFVTYLVKPRGGIGKCPWKSRAWVKFTSARREEKTNQVSTSFKANFSLGLKAMYNYFPEENGINYYSAGLELGNDKHCGWDPRLSVMFGVEQPDALTSGSLDKYYLDIALTPFRVDLIRASNGKWNFLGIGLGAQFSMIFIEEVEGVQNRDRVQKWTGFGDLVILSKRKGPRIGAQFHAPIGLPKPEDTLNPQIDFDNFHMQFYATWAF